MENSNLQRLPVKAGTRSATKHATGFQDPGPRSAVLIEKFGMDKIQEFYKQILAGEKVPLSSADCLIIGRIARATKSDEAQELLYNRRFGKVPDKNINLNVNVDADPEKLSERASEMLARLQD